MTRYRFPATRPELPAPAAWLPFVEKAYAANWFANFGAVSRQLESALLARWGSPASASVVTSSGTAALAAPLIALRVEGPVLLPAFTFPATLSAVKMAGAQPYLVDVSAEDWRVTPAAFDGALKRSGARAAILLCPFGLRTDFNEHIEIARRRGAILVIDNAAGLGVERAHVETSADVFEAYSLHATKPFGVGEGGMIFAHRSRENALRQALNFGLSPSPGEEGPGWGINGKMAEIQAAVGLAVMATFEDRLARRRAFARTYMDALSRYEGIRFPRDPEGSCWQMFPVLMPSEQACVALGEAAARQGMETRRYYRPSLSTMNNVAGDHCPVSEDLAARMCCLPVYSLLSGEEAGDMLGIVNAAFPASL